jgi:DNA-binding NtrC family response regulator
MRYVEAVGPSSNPVLITGETGSGKELIARACHRSSGLSGEFVAVNVAGLDEQLFADTLFGHRRGAFTGANVAREGLLARGEGGTVVLDEIGDLSTGSQLKLLRVLQEREYLPLGSDQSLPVRARIIATTNQPLATLRDPNHFRQDLFYRLAVHHIHLPPLRERRPDVLPLWEHFLARQAELLDRPVPESPSELLDLLMAYSFPGNVRELESLAAEAMNIVEHGRIEAAAVRHRLVPAGVLPVTPVAAVPSTATAAEPAADAAARNGVSFGDPLPPLRDIKRLLVEEAIRRAGGNKARAAALIGTTRQALNHW